MHFLKALGALALASSVLAQNQTYCASDNVCYDVNVPEATASSGSGDLYFHMSGPSTMSWIGLGQGTSMTGSNIFLIYADAAGTNVTLSPRLGIGEKSPSTDSSANLTLLEGSGISNGMMVANVRCSNCNSWSGGSMSFTDAESKWIWAYKSGSPISSDSTTAPISYHTTMGETTLNLQQARGGSTANPFIAMSAATMTPNTNSGSSSSSSSGSSGGAVKVPSNFRAILMAHGVLGGMAFALFFPVGGMAMRLLNFKGLVWVHAGFMVFTYTMALAVLGMGVWIAHTLNKLDTYHAIIGIVVIGCLILQPLTGLLHHMLYKTKGRPNAATYPHIWWGRVVVTLGTINGGFGLQLADIPGVNETKKGQIGYGVVAGVIWVTWMIVIALSFVRSRGKKEGETGEGIFMDGRPGSGEKIRHSGSETAGGSISGPEDARTHKEA